MPKSKRELPRPLKRSPEKAKRTFIKAHDSAEQTYDSPKAAHRTAYAALKHSFEKKGDRWVQKDEKGPPDPRSKQPSSEDKRAGKGETYGGVDVYQNTKEELYERARELDIRGRSRMSKAELARAIGRKQG